MSERQTPWLFSSTEYRTASKSPSAECLRHPTLLTQGELTRAIASDPEDFDQRDDVVRAVAELRGAGLLHRQGAFVFPSYAALRFDRLVCS